jgi:hypothetical protein
MKNKKDRWLVVLLCVNALLLTGVVMHYVELPQAQAQTARAGNAAGGEYFLLPGRIQSQSGEVVWVVDVSNQLLTNCLYNRNRGEIQFGEILDLNQVYDNFLVPAVPTTPDSSVVPAP